MAGNAIAPELAVPDWQAA